MISDWCCVSWVVMFVSCCCCGRYATVAFPFFHPLSIHSAMCCQSPRFACCGQLSVYRTMKNSYHPSLSGLKSPPKWIKCIHHRLPPVSNKRGRPKLISDAAILGRRRTMVGGNMRSSELPRPTPAYQTRRRGVNDSKQARFRW